ncbi:MAG TPA: hypothetical protein GXX21_09860 [Syntrophomonadaceae bacterium]|nr:hypothetical protein [Thermoanaerobacterales bacterium]HHW29840.1 hypothetical protein [Syntrophomonadaceae bacterium]
MDWERIMSDAEMIKNKLLLLNVNLSEAEKLGNYFSYKKYDERAINRYLRIMAESPPPRSKKTQRHYKGLQQIWREWRTNLKGEEKAIAWGWGVKLAHAGKR